MKPFTKETIYHKTEEEPSSKKESVEVHHKSDLSTPNSIYQATLKNHISGSPPNTDPQREKELFSSYVERMKAHGFPPDIGPNESDAAYVKRLASYTAHKSGSGTLTVV